MDETKHRQHLHQAALGERFLIEQVDIRGEHKRRLLTSVSFRVPSSKC